MSVPQPGGRPVRVLASFPEPRPTTNPYIVMLKEAVQARDDVALDTFSWRRALTGSYDVFHAHWPEILVNGHSPLKKAVRQALFVAAMLRWRALGTAIVRTAHNLELPQGITRREQMLLRWFERRTDLRIRLNDVTDVPGEVETVPHGHYVDWFSTRGDASIRPVPGRAVYVGLIRRYKAVDTLVGAWADLPAGAEVERLVVAGAASSDDLLQQVTDAAHGDPRVEIRPGFLTEEALADLVRSATLVVQPAPAMHNSGTVLAALSLGRPVLVPDNEVNRRLAAEVGPGWIHTFAGDLTAADLERAVREAASTLADPAARPDLSLRDWDRSADGHARAYRRAATLAHGRVPRRPALRHRRAHR